MRVFPLPASLSDNFNLLTSSTYAEIVCFLPVTCTSENGNKVLPAVCVLAEFWMEGPALLFLVGPHLVASRQKANSRGVRGAALLLATRLLRL